MKNVILVLVLSILFAAISVAQETEIDDVIKVNTALVSIPVVVTDRQGRHISGLTANDFTIFEDGKKQEVGFFATAEEPINVALLLDTSRSTSDVIDKIKAAAVNFVSLLNADDRAMIVTFDSRVNVLSSLTSNRIELEKAIRNVEIGFRAGTVMRDAVVEVINRQFAKVNGRKAIILLTDGKDFGSYSLPDDLLNSLEESDVMVYSVFYKTSMVNQNAGRIQRNRGRNRGGVFGGMGGGRNRNDRAREREREADEDAKDYLEKMSKLTAGRFYKKEVKNLRETFSLIADELRKQYRIGFYPAETSSANSVHEIKVKVDRKNVAVNARSSYRRKSN